MAQLNGGSVIRGDGIIEGDLTVSGDITGVEQGTIDIDSYGADPTGETPSDQAFDDALSDASEGDTIRFRSGRYLLEQDHLIEKPVTIVGNGAVVDIDNTSGTASISFEGTGLTGNSTGLPNGASEGDQTIDVSDTSIFSVGDTVRFADQDWANDTHKFDFGVIKSIGSGNITVDTVMTYDYPDAAGGGQVERVDLLDGARIEGLRTNLLSDTGSILDFRWCHRPVARNLHIDGYTIQSGWFHDSWRGVYDNVTATRATHTESGQGYGMIVYRCQDCSIRSPRIGYCRHGVDVSNGSHDINITDPIVRDAQLAGIHLHHELGRNVSVYGGTVVANTGISHRPQCDNFVVNGTTFYVRSKLAQLDNRSKVTGINAMVIEDSSDGVTIYGNDVHIDGTVQSRGGIYDDLYYLDNTENQNNLTLNLDSREVANRVGRITADRTLSDLDITGTHIAPSGSTSVTLRIDGLTVDGFDLSLTSEGYDDGVVCYSGTTIRDVNLHKCDISSVNGDSFRGTASINENIRAMQNNFPSGDGLNLGSGTTNATVIGNTGAINVSGTNIYTDGNV